MVTHAKPQLLNPREAADFLHLTEGTLEVWRSTKRYALAYHKIGGRVYYDIDDLIEWLRSRKVRG
jgi:hypothetical protein